MSTELYEELEKIEKATSGLFKGKAKSDNLDELLVFIAAKVL